MIARLARGRSASLILAPLIVAIALVGIPGPAVQPADAAALSAWNGGINLYRSGVFTTQKTWWYCTAADVQIMRNIVRREADHSTASQKRYFDFMRRRNRYDIPVKAGVDPAGWTAGLRRFVDDRYRLVASKTFDGALRAAVIRIRLTNLPVALAVAHGNHGWVLHGFTATADPSVTREFTITSVRVTGPLYGLQSRNGYDMKPNTKLTPSQLERFFTRWHYDPLPMIWDGLYVSIQPVPTRASTSQRGTASPSTVSSAAPMPMASTRTVPLLGYDRGAGSVDGAAIAPPAAPLAPTSRGSPSPTASPSPSPPPAPAAAVLQGSPVSASVPAVGIMGAGLAGLLVAVVASIALLASRRRSGPG